MVYDGMIEQVLSDGSSSHVISKLQKTCFMQMQLFEFLSTSHFLSHGRAHMLRFHA